MRIMWVTNAPWSSSAYGRIIRELLFNPDFNKPFLTDFPSALTANFGLHGGIINFNKIPIYPGGRGFSERETLQNATHFKADIIIPVYDLWALEYLPKESKKRNLLFVPYTAFDWLDIYPKLYDKLKFSDFIISFSKYGENLCKKYNFNATTIYPGVNTRIFYPIEDIPKTTLRTKLGFEEDSFIITLVQMNKGIRKGIPEQLEAIKIFCENNPDIKTRIYLHTHPIGVEGGFDLKIILKLLGLEEITRFPDPYEYLTGFSDEQMNLVYNASDVLLECSWGEGFGCPVLEAQACGIPVIASNHTSLTELLQYTTPELLVKIAHTLWVPVPSKVSIPDKYDIAKKLEIVVNSDPQHYKKICSSFARKYDTYKYCLPTWIKTLRKIEELKEERCLKIPIPSQEIIKNTEKITIIQ